MCVVGLICTNPRISLFCIRKEVVDFTQVNFQRISYRMSLSEVSYFVLGFFSRTPFPALTYLASGVIKGFDVTMPFLGGRGYPFVSVSVVLLVVCVFV